MKEEHKKEKNIITEKNNNQSTDNKKSQFIGFEKKENNFSERQEKSEKQELKELLEKNLKWSQIIYEQNRRISRRLLLNTIVAGLKWLIILAIIVWGYWYSRPYVRNIMAQYETIKKQSDLIDSKLDGSTLDKILNILPLNQSQQEQIKAMSN